MHVTERRRCFPICHIFHLSPRDWLPRQSGPLRAQYWSCPASVQPETKKARTPAANSKANHHQQRRQARGQRGQVFDELILRHLESCYLAFPIWLRWSLNLFVPFLSFCLIQFFYLVEF